MSLSIKPIKIFSSTESSSELEFVQFSFPMNYTVDYLKDKIRVMGTICFLFVSPQYHKTLIWSAALFRGLQSTKHTWKSALNLAYQIRAPHCTLLSFTSCFILVRIPEQTVKYDTIQNLKNKRNPVLFIADKTLFILR